MAHRLGGAVLRRCRRVLDARASDGLWGFVPAAINILGTGQQAGYFKASIPVGALVSMFVCVSVRRAQQAAAAKREQASDQA